MIGLVHVIGSEGVCIYCKRNKKTIDSLPNMSEQFICDATATNKLPLDWRHQQALDEIEQADQPIIVEVRHAKKGR